MKIMNKVTMVIWGLIIFALCFVILMLGFKQKQTDYYIYTTSLKDAGKQYVKDFGIEPKIGDSIIIKIDDLIDGQYIKEDEKLEKYCIEGIVYTKGIISGSYSLKQSCEVKE